MLRFQFLPHYFKYVAIVLYLVFGLPVIIDNFILGFREGLYDFTSSDPQAAFFLPPFFHSHIGRILTYLAIIIYALSKDRTFDEMMIKLRLESIYIVFFGTILFLFGRLLFNTDVSISASLLVEVQVICVIILNAIQKRTLFK